MARRVPSGLRKFSMMGPAAVLLMVTGMPDCSVDITVPPDWVKATSA